MDEPNNNNADLLTERQYTCQTGPDSRRRRRVCSVVVPMLKVEYTEEGKRTVVVSDAHDSQNTDAIRPAENMTKTTIPAMKYPHSARSYSESRGQSDSVASSESLSVTADKAQAVLSSPQRRRSLSRRAELKNIEYITVQDTLKRGVFPQATGNCEINHKHSAEFMSPGLTPSATIRRTSCERPSNREAFNRAELAINLSEFPKTGTHKLRCSSSQRKTQRSMSAHSVALPGPDSSVLRDPVTGKMYKRGKLLGKGGFARVYEGLELSTNKKYAMKIIDKSRLARPPQREKVETEIELHCAASKVGHPNVAGFETNFENARIICIVMELCEKRSLAQHLRRKEFLSETEVSDIVWQIICGLAHIHGCGLYHRDLKLGNILLAEDMTAKIGDFGLATRASWGSRKTICGTPNFIAPEVLQRQGHGPEADIWAVGCILYTLLVGKPPFETSSLKDTYKCILKNSYRIPSTVSQEAADLVRWMLRSKPSTRPTVYDVTKHAFFVKNQTGRRLPDLDKLATTHPSEEVSTERFLPLRRKSVLPRLTVVDQLSGESACCSQLRHNSCPSDPCSVYSMSSNTLRNVPLTSTGPRTSVNNDVQNASSSSSCTKTCIEDDVEKIKISSHGQTQDGTNAEFANVGQLSLSGVGKLILSPSTDSCEKRKKCLRFVNDIHDSPKNNNKNSSSGVMEQPKGTTTRKPMSASFKTKKSPVKTFASKLQKLKLPSPKKCMKVAAHTMKTKPNGCKTTAEIPVIPTIVLPVKESETTWITKWVDYSNKYGFGYQLADGTICVLFNDGSHIALMPDGKTIEYAEPEWESSSAYVFPLQSPPNALRRFVKILQHFTLYMDNNLRRGKVAVPRNRNECEEDKPCLSVRMLTWSRTRNHVAMYLNNGTLQVNFCTDHTKINVSNIHGRSAMSVSYLDEKKETRTYRACDIERMPASGLYDRLRHVHEEFHFLFGSDGCTSHPFCGLVRDNAFESVLKSRSSMITVG